VESVILHEWLRAWACPRWLRSCYVCYGAGRPL